MCFSFLVAGFVKEKYSCICVVHSIRGFFSMKLYSLYGSVQWYHNRREQREMNGDKTRKMNFAIKRESNWKPNVAWVPPGKEDKR